MLRRTLCSESRSIAGRTGVDDFPFSPDGTGSFQPVLSLYIFETRRRIEPAAALWMISARQQPLSRDAPLASRTTTDDSQGLERGPILEHFVSQLSYLFAGLFLA